MRNKILLFIFLIIVLGATAFAIEHKRTTGQVQQVTFGNATHAITGLVAVAQAQGFFSAQGLQVDLQPYPSGALALQALQKGTLDMATAAETPIAFGAFKYHNFKVLATVGTTDTEEKIIARKDHGITTAADLRGKNIATHQKGSSPHFFLHIFLAANGIADSDAHISFLDVKQLVPLLTKGSLDAISVSEPYGSQAIAALGSNATVFPDQGLYQRSYNLIASDSFIAAHPDLVKKVLTALVNAETFAKANPQQAMQDTAKVEGISMEEVQQGWPGQQLHIGLDQTLLTSLGDEARWAQETNQVSATSTLPNFLNYMYLNGLEQVSPNAVTIIH